MNTGEDSARNENELPVQTTEKGITGSSDRFPVVIVTDSTCDIKRSVTHEMGVVVVPLSVIHEGKVYRDGIDITTETFYPMLKSSGDTLPTTSQPTYGEFLETYKSLLDEGKEIVSIHISRGLSATVENAGMASMELGTDRIFVFDSGFASYALGMQVLEAVRLAQQGMSGREIVSHLSRLRDQMDLIFTLDTLIYLQKGGRIGKVSSLLGNMLGIKPIIRIENGVTVPQGKTRSMKQALSSITDYLQRKYGDSRVRVSVGDGYGTAAAERLTDMLSEALNVEGSIDRFGVGPVIGVHTGPGTVGVAVHQVEY